MIITAKFGTHTGYLTRDFEYPMFDGESETYEYLSTVAEDYAKKNGYKLINIEILAC